MKYSGGNSCCNKALFMKQKRQIQMGVGQYKNAATPEVYNFDLSEGAQKLLVKAKM